RLSRRGKSCGGIRSQTITKIRLAGELGRTWCRSGCGSMELRPGGGLLRSRRIHFTGLARLLRRSRKTDAPRAAATEEFLKCLGPRLAAFALLRRSRKTDAPRAAATEEFLKCLGPRLAAFALLWNSFRARLEAGSPPNPAVAQPTAVSCTASRRTHPRHCGRDHRKTCPRPRNPAG